MKDTVAFSSFKKIIIKRIWLKFLLDDLNRLFYFYSI